MVLDGFLFLIIFFVIRSPSTFFLKESALALYSWLRVGTYSIVQQSEEDEENSNKLRIMGVAYTKEL